jgi:transcriptional regulator with XRE-family HTH domain
MERPGEKLKRVRERLTLTYRDVEKASRQIAARRGSDSFTIALSRLADIEHNGTIPTIHRIYTLCAIYRLDYEEVLRWYGVTLEMLESEAMQIGLRSTHAFQFTQVSQATVPQAADYEIDPHKTTFLSHLVRRWGRMPLSFLNGLDIKQYRYGFIGLDDWSMYPILRPGSLVAIDQTRQKVAADGWTSELDRPIYFLEHRNGYRCGWCTHMGENILILPHPASHQPPLLFKFPNEIDVVGQVMGVAMLIESRKHRSVRHTPKVQV